MFDESAIKIRRTVYKSGKVCYIGTYGKVEKQLILKIETIEDLYDFDNFALEELTNQIRKEVVN
jgi:hypothetical protein